MTRQPPYCERCDKFPCIPEQEQECRDALANQEEDVKEERELNKAVRDNWDVYEEDIKEDEK